eukprot:TRINITY_DN3698_c0_g1_i1.p1 TRINITY_DN3698_c0_g1~~TRINITY_DN3698_c0_g1_i1.p1  ORF type:complete len:203 (+),score=47.12 TRINITY_DN3698_c0_g1_i1:301-909(+)
MIALLYGWVAAVCAVSTIGFSYYGYVLYRTFQRVTVNLNSRRESLLRTVSVVTSVTLLCLVTRTAVIVSMTIDNDIRLFYTEGILALYFFLTEQIPLFLIMFILRKTPGPELILIDKTPIYSRPTLRAPINIGVSYSADQSVASTASSVPNSFSAPVPFFRHHSSAGAGSGSFSTGSSGSVVGSFVDRPRRADSPVQELLTP